MKHFFNVFLTFSKQRDSENESRDTNGHTNGHSIYAECNSDELDSADETKPHDPSLGPLTEEQEHLRREEIAKQREGMRKRNIHHLNIYYLSFF